MGMEGVELVIRLESEFGITLDVEELPELETVGDLYGLVEARIAARDSHRCLALTLFREVRAETRQFLGDPHRKLRPRDEVVDVVPWRQRRAFWRKLGGRFKAIAYWDLTRPILGCWLIAAFCLGTIVFLFYQMIVPRGPDYFAPLGLLLICLLPFFLRLVTRPLKLVPPVHLETFGQIVRSELGRTIATKAPPENPRQVVDDLLIDVLGVSREELVPTARLVKDLGMG